MKKVYIPQLTPHGGTLTGYLHDPDDIYIFRGIRPGILVIPGGGYQKLAGREKDPVAFEYFAEGFNTFVLEYSIQEYAPGLEPLGLKPLKEASAAIIAIRENAADWNTNPNQIAALGFSAGGHLAASCATLWDCEELKKEFDTRGGMNRPDAAILCYAVTLTGEFGHEGSARNLAGDGDPSFYNLVNHIGSHTPPVFLWTTVTDELVPPENTLMFAQGLQANHIPYELHMYPYGRHGLTLGKMETNEDHPHLATWVGLSKMWLSELFGFSISRSYP